MSDNESGERSKIGLARWLVPAIIFAAAILVYGGIQNGIYYFEASRYAANYAKDAQYQIAKECVVTTDASSCARQIEQSLRQNQREEFDLYSQKAMALWTAIMGAMAVIGISLSGVGVYLIWRTWDATREAAENSRRTLDSYIWKERGHVEVVKASYIAVSPEPYRDGVFLEFRNMGLSPAEVAIVNYQIIPDKAWKPNNMPSIAKRLLVPAGDTREWGVLIFRKLSEGWLVGSVEYTTLKHQRFKTYFCFEVVRTGSESSGKGGWHFSQIFPAAMPGNT